MLAEVLHLYLQTFHVFFKFKLLKLKLSHLLVQEETKGFLPSLALEGIRPESQAFAYAQALPEATASRIDQAISALKRSGVVSELRQQATTRENSQGR